MTEPESLTIAPEAGSWRSQLRHNRSPEALRFRGQMGLPTDRPVVMTGHQAEFWHPGILAKYLAADAFAAAGGEQAPGVAFLVVDQDRPERTVVRYPVVEARGNLGVREIAYGIGGDPPPPGPGATPPFVRDGLRRIGEALAAHAGEPTVACRVAFATRDLMAPLLTERGRSARVLFASGLHRADLFGELVERMGREPERCIHAYNAAALAHPGAGIRALVADEVQDRWELPLWRLPPGSPRSHVYAEDLPGIPREELAPKALFMTGLLRLAGCDLFIHGLGGGGGDAGGGYDAITDAWLTAWLGEEAVAALAPVTVVTATRYLPLESAASPAPTPAPTLAPAEAARAVWRAHHARHIPAELGLDGLDEQRRSLVGQIAAADRRTRHRLYRDLHHLLDRYRAEHSEELAALAERAESERARLGDPAILHDRTWAFPLYPAGMLDELREGIRRALGAG